MFSYMFSYIYLDTYFEWNVSEYIVNYIPASSVFRDIIDLSTSMLLAYTFSGMYAEVRNPI